MKKMIDFKEKEEHWREFWQRENIYKFDPKSEKKVFSVDTPPPYISADSLHVGHVASYCQAEIVVRYKRMRGYNVFYPMGFDDNGLPTEKFVEKKYKIAKSKIKKQEFVKLCLTETNQGGQAYRNLFRQLGFSIDWALTYSTINEHCQRIAQRSFLDLYQKGFVVRRREPVIWCPACQTALAQAELDDRKETAFLYYIKFNLPSEVEDQSFLTVATTRPELLPACVALYVNSNDQKYKKYIGKKVTVPLFDYQVPILADDLVDPDYGTGIMMVCTWGDSEDVMRWKRDKLLSRVILQDNGDLNDIAGKYKNLNALKARSQINEDLKLKDLLIKREEISHICNVHDKCQEKIEFVLKPQWFIKIKEDKATWIERGNQINWRPYFMKSKYNTWVKGLKWDWCISRQRAYGVPFPIWYCRQCQKVLLPEDKDLPVDPREQTIFKQCDQCGSQTISPENDVMDTWMTSSVTPLINAFWQYSNEDNLMSKIYPMDMRPQGLDIIKTWLFYTIVKSHYHTNSLPWKDVMISGWGVDSQGKKMSKSLGNFISADQTVEKYPVDAIRYWTTKAGLGQNLKYQEQELQVAKKLIVKLWNASNFCFIHLKNDLVLDFELEKLDKLDKGMLTVLQGTIGEYIQNFDEYQFSKARANIDHFFWHYFCDNYLEMIKDKLYNPEKYHPISTQSTKYTLYVCLLAIIKLYAPILPFITEEIYHLFFIKYEKQISIHISQLPNYNQAMINKSNQIELEAVIEVISAIRKYKSEHKLSLKTEIKKVTIQTSLANIKDYFSFIKTTMNIKECLLDKGDSKDIKIIIAT